MIAVRHLKPVQHTATKSLKNGLKKSEDVIMKPCYIKMAALWLAWDLPSETKGVTAGVIMVLDWLERRLMDGFLPLALSGRTLTC